MKTICKSRMRLFVTACFIIGCTACFGQKPVIRAVDKTAAANGEIVTLQGTFNNDITQAAVSFGAAKGSVEFISNQLIEVAMPPGATYDNVVVTDLSSGLSAQSAFPFLSSFGGVHGVTAASLEGQIDFNSESGLYDVCMCDFDNDGRTDVATANEGANTMNVLANTTPLPGLANISFNSIPFLIGARSIHARCGDLNGDGKPDLIISEGASGDRLFVFRNTSSGAGVFTFSIQTVSLAGKKVKRTEIADLDNDGKPEVIVTNQTGNNITVLVNQSTPAAISFAASPLTFTIPDAASTDALAVEDLDGDGLPDIVTSQFLTPTSNLYIFKNTSIPGNISFAAVQSIIHDGPIANLKVGDLDGDAKPEIVTTQLLESGVSIFKNQSTTTPAFAAPIAVLTDERPWGVDFGDIDGDGKPDIVVASLTKKSVSVLNNNSTSAALAFSTLVQGTTYINRHVGVGDVDGDAKPDIVFTSIDDNSTNVLASKVSVLRNKSCLLPTLNPAGPIAICTGFPLQLKAAASRGTQYEWKNGASTVANGPDAFYDVTVAGSYTVTATGENGSCSEVSNSVTVTVDPGVTSGVAVAANDGPVCTGSTLSLSVNDVSATDYNWSGPNGYTGTGVTPAAVANFQSLNVGRYYLDVVVNGCIAQQTSTVAEMISTPDFQVTYSGSDVICPPDTKTLSIVPDDPDFSYQWAERTAGDIAGETASTLSVSATGQYYVKAQYIPNPSCAAIETEDADITFSTPPVAAFSAPLTACAGQSVTFTNQSTGDAAVARFYQWTFGDAQTSALESPAHAFASANSYAVTLTVSYNNGACQDQVTENITIENAPSVSITTSASDFVVCSGGTLQLGVSGTFAAYEWSTNETTPTIQVTMGGTYSVDVTTASCVVTAAVVVDEVAGPLVIATANPTQVIEGGTSQLSVAGLTSYLWDPAESLSDPSIVNPVASPVGTTIYSVTGTDENGCPGSATIEVSVKGDYIVNKLSPSKFISPENGDAMNNYWLIGSILDYPQCSVAIYDDKGIKVYEAKPYINEWEGTYRGKQLPDGVYYYIIRCDGEENHPRSGSITVLR